MLQDLQNRHCPSVEVFAPGAFAFDEATFSRAEAAPEERDFICFTASGRWTGRDMDRHLASFKAEVARARGLGKPVRILSDMREVEIGERAEERLKANMPMAFEPDDRIALVVRSSASKAQLRRAMDGWTAQMFLSLDAARLWLGAV